MKRTTIILLATLALLTACETIEGLGRDTQKLGGNIQDAVKSTK